MIRNFYELLDQNVYKICDWVSEKQDSLDTIMDNMSLIIDTIGLKDDLCVGGDVKTSLSDSDDDGDDDGNIDSL